MSIAHAPTPAPESAASAAWAALASHARGLAAHSIAAQLEGEGPRVSRLGPTSWDHGKQRLDARAWELLLAWAEAAGATQAIEAMFAGESINRSEARPALHVALRAHEEDAGDIAPEAVRDAIAERTRMYALVESLRTGERRGATDRRFTDLVHIGIGGSALGPRLVCEALDPRSADAPRVHFLDPLEDHARHELLAALDPERTLVCVASKSFGTVETLYEAEQVRAWVRAGLGEAQRGWARHFVAASAELEAVRAWGIEASQMLRTWDWVGGRYSAWSAVGFPIAWRLGAAQHGAWLEGAREVDRHLREASLAEMLPLRRALLGIYLQAFEGLDSQCVLTYDGRLRSWVPYLQQLFMESNGKCVDVEGRALPASSPASPWLWGGPGVAAQHAYLQQLHQGPRAAAVEFLAVVRDPGAAPESHRQRLTNCLAQSRALMIGRQVPGEPHRCMPGDRPSTLWLLDQLDARAIGMLMATAEHEVYLRGALLGVNSFDQWGVELGKGLAREIAPQLDAGHEDTASADSLDASTRELLRRIRAQRDQSV